MSSEQPTVLIIGATGQTGRLIVADFARDPGNVRLRLAARKQADIARIKSGRQGGKTRCLTTTVGTPATRVMASESPLGFLDGDGPGRKIDPESIIPQHARADQDLIALHKRRLHSNCPAIEWEIDKEDVFLDSLICCQK
jgi:hypothetical protein